MAFRVLRNCSQEDMREIRFSELRVRLMERGFRARFIDSAIEKVKMLDRSSVLAKVVREDQTQDRVRAIFRYDKRLPDLSGIFRKNWQTMVSDDQRLLSVFPKPPMICFSRAKNQREELCQAKLPPHRTAMATRTGPGHSGDGFKRCGRSRCRL